MFRRPTLFVIGAGAGFDLNMPLGGPLSAKIADSLQFRFDEERFFRPLKIRKIMHGEGKIRDALSIVSEDDEETLKAYIEAAKTIGDAVQNMRSIDNFVLAHSHDEKISRCAKIAIVYRILQAERDSHLGVKKGGFKYDESVRKSWLHDFLTAATSHRPARTRSRLTASQLILISAADAVGCDRAPAKPDRSPFGFSAVSVR